MGGIGRFSDHRCRASASWCGGAWRQPERRTFGIKQSDRQKIRSFLYVSFVFDDRAFFAIPRCATVSFTVGIEPFISDGGKMAGLGIFSFVFLPLYCFFIEAGTDLNVDRENTESSVFNFVEYFCYSGAFFTGRKYE